VKVTQSRRQPESTRERRERAILAGVHVTSRRADPSVQEFDPEESLSELRALTESAGAEVVESILQTRETLDHATVLGAGKVDEIKAMVRAIEADVVIFDHELGGTQQRNLEKALECKVLDRTQLILDIFARRARTREGQLQVELAQLNYLLPRLSGHGASMSRLGGGIGTRGPGETKLETDRRRIHRRIRKVEQDLESVKGSRHVQRRKRLDVPLSTVALVGYTNAGKSTLFNRLTGAGVTADSRLFATLDPTVRQVVLPSRRRVLFSDTVGFIRRLPTTLVKAFRATLEEVTQATLLLHVVDSSSPVAAEHCAHVRAVLSEIGAEATPQILALNKADLLASPSESPDSIVRRLTGEAGGIPGVSISAATGEGIERLLALIDSHLPDDPIRRARFHFPPHSIGKAHILHEYGQVVKEEFSESGCDVTAEVPESVRLRLKDYTTA
jgi:GTP-binding protein HflX